MTHELEAVVDPVGLEVVKVEPATWFGAMGFAGEVDELGQGAANLAGNSQRIAI